MLQNPCKTLGFKKNMVYKIPLGGGGKPYPASGLNCMFYSYIKVAFLMCILQCATKSSNTGTLYKIGKFSLQFLKDNQFSIK